MQTHSPHPITTTTKTFTNRTTHVDTTKTITHIGLCAGYGGIELGLGRVLPTLRSVALCEIEAFPIANLVSKMEAGLMDAAPVWTDLKSFPWESFRDRVDILTGGYPCQPFSAAGKRAGKDDPRHLWPWIADGIRILRPRMCFFENVEGHISLGLSSVISDLEELGYKVSWGIFSAREVGAPHQRKRVFILAHDKSNGLEKQCKRPIKSEEGGFRVMHPIGIRPCVSTAWPSRPGEPQHAWEPPRVVGNANIVNDLPNSAERKLCEPQQGRPCGESVGTASHAAMVDAIHNAGFDVCGTQCGQAQQSISSDSGSMGNSDPRRLASSINTRSGEEADRGGQGDIEQAESGQAQPPLGRDAHGTSDWMDYAELYTTCDNRTDELRLLGNGVVPATAERAFRTLLKELTCHN